MPIFVICSINEKYINFNIIPYNFYFTFSQSFRIPKNVLSTSLFQPFAAISGYTISFERLIDPGYSLNAAQFSYKLNTTLISYNQKKEYATIDSQVFYDKEAYKFFGFTLFYLN